MKHTKISTGEQRRLQDRVKNRQDVARRRYRAIRGKKVDFVEHGVEENVLYLSIRFQDGTEFNVRYEPTLKLSGVEYCDMKSGDAVVLEEYFSN